jgi:ribosomal protein L37E
MAQRLSGTRGAITADGYGVVMQAIEQTGTDVALSGEVGFLVTGQHCDRCGDVNYDTATATRVCLTCTYPDHPCSRAYLDGALAS